MFLSNRLSVKQLHQWVGEISGSKQALSIEQCVFNCAIFIALLMFVFGMIFTLVHAWWLATAGLFVCTAVFAYVYYLGRYADKLQRAVFIFATVVIIALNVMWILDRGASGSTAFYLFIILLIIIFTASKPAPYLAAMLLDLVVMGIFQEPLQTIVNWQLPYPPSAQYLSLISAVVYMGILTLLYRGLMQDKSHSQFTTIVNELRQGSEQTNIVADSLVESGDALSTAALQQKTAIEQLMATTEELAATAEQNNQLASDSITILRQVEAQIDDSKSNTDQLVEFIQDIKRSGEEIQNINNVINEIAWQTNLLSLNAMIEASRAGDAHGGFKVVALEVKRLAEQSAEAANKINQLLAANLDSIQQGVDFSQNMQKAFDVLIDEITPLGITVRNMSDASIEQTQAILQINQGLSDIDTTVTRNQQAAEETAKTAVELRRNSGALLGVVRYLQGEA